MLKALEVSGFKSFAEKTRFEFPAGITVVVGPNGSGKSNIVDAIKWVLGEQSAKSLRGKEMSDVIFKGTGGPNGRRPANAAQATIVLENQNRVFDYDADEVHVSRRVYRSGETEYLINGEASRLKDIRSLFRGTGVGTDAYSLIEQGKVERMLQTNPQDRRAIFEEAAGISRFKAKKVETERRLARVEANLVRLADIVEEVGSRYRSVKAQASKAARYKEYSDRLKTLRTSVGMNDWREYSQQLAAIEEEAKTLAQQCETLKETVASESAALAAIDDRFDSIAGELQKHQQQSIAAREQITRFESQRDLNESRTKDVASRQPQTQAQRDSVQARAQSLAERIETSTKELEEAELKFREVSDQLEQHESALQEFDAQLTAIGASSQTQRGEISSVLEQVGVLGNLISSNEQRITNFTESRDRTQAEAQRIAQEIERHEGELAATREAMREASEEAESRDQQLKDARENERQLRSELERLRQQQNVLTNQHTGRTQRSQVIEELESSLVGVGAGARDLLHQSQTSDEGHLREIIGLVADLVSVNVQHAGLVDVALGEVAQYIVVDGRQMIDLLAREQLKVSGRVGLIELTQPSTLGADPSVNLAGRNGVIGRADRLVQVQPPHEDFIRQMLGGTWIVKTLRDALALQDNEGKGARFVTLDGEIVESDGSIVVGPKAASMGIVSRRSELRSLHREIAKLDEEIETVNQSIAQRESLHAEASQHVETLMGENSQLTADLSRLETKATVTQNALVGLQAELEKQQSENQSVVSSLASLALSLADEQARLHASQQQADLLRNQIAQSESESALIASQQQATQRQATAAKVQLAKWEQQLDDLAHRKAQAIDERRETEETLVQLNKQMESDVAAARAAEELIAEAVQSLSRLQAEHAAAADAAQSLSLKRSEVDAERVQLRKSATEHRDALRRFEDQAHHASLRIEQLTTQRTHLAERIQEDYGIDIAEFDGDELDGDEESLLNPEQQRDAIDLEINDLRKKIGMIGSVNLDALSELEELESRYLKMDAQYQDLVTAKETLEKIIVRINADSRKLFVETLEAIRLNFQKLFRQTFGGGHADIILEEGVDPLDAGVEIIATPPGKPEFNNSLLSGGEKALTAVSLLMAIFQFRPSPFCVLDEVDAPFDEANIGRFIDVLKSFLGWTKFVIVTHSKKTMTAATTLYGITMQESGVSKRVSVRFEDVSDDGEISDDAVKRTDNEDAA